MKCIYAALISVIIGLGWANVATAQNCSSHRPVRYNPTVFTYSNTYQYPVKEVVVKENVIVKDVIVPVAVPVLIPAFQFQYVAPCASPVAAQVVPQIQGAPVANPFPVGQQMQPMTGSPYSAAPASAPAPATSEQQRIRQLARALLLEMSRQEESPSEDDGPPMAIGEFIAQPVQRQQPAQNAGNWLQVLSNRCARCHTGAKAASGIQIFTAPGQFNPSVDRQRLISAIEGGRMPLAGSPEAASAMSPQEIAIVRAGLSGR